jgi:archaellum component FlaG (FlaF/FlaG flagellin family)
MSASQTTPSPLARLVLFMVCLAIAGSVVAGIQYVAVDIPQQTATIQSTPENNCLAWETYCMKDPGPGSRDECCSGPCASQWDYC